MDYGGRYYPIADSRFPVYYTYSTIPDRLYNSAPLTPITTPQQPRIIQYSSGDWFGTKRLAVVPSIRRLYYGLDDDDDEDPEPRLTSSVITNRPACSRVLNYLDNVCQSPKMDEIESETRKIRRDAQVILHRLNQPIKKKPIKLSSIYCPDLTYTSSSTSSYYPRTYSSYGRTSAERDVTPDVDSTHFRPSRAYTYAPTRILHDPIAKVQSEINRKAIYSEQCRKINDSVRGAVRRPKASDTETVKNNINFRAQYASLRAAANVGLRKANDYLMV